MARANLTYWLVQILGYIINHPNYGTVGIDLNDKDKIIMKDEKLVIKELIKLQVLPNS